MAYGTEIWRWREKEDIERIDKKYLRWILDVRERTLGYLVRVVMQREKMRERVGESAQSLKKRLEAGKESKIAR